MESKIQHLITAGPYKDKYVDQVPDRYLRALISSEWIRINETVIYNAAIEECRKRGISPVERRVDENALASIKAEMEHRFNRIHGDIAKDYHPDTHDNDERFGIAMKAVNSYAEKIQAALEELLPDSTS